MVRKLLYLNGWAIWMSVLYHSSAWGFIAMFWWTDRYRPVQVPNFEALGSATYFGLRFIEGAVAFGIPAFLFVSGFFSAFAAGRSRDTIGFDVILPRIRRLFIPYFLWTSVFVLLDALLTGEAVGPLEFVQKVLTGQATQAFYFVPVLIQLYLLSPLMIPWAKKHPRRLLALAGGLQALVALTRYMLILGMDAPDVLQLLARSYLFPGYGLWFAWGMVFGFHQVGIKQALVPRRWLFLAAAGVLLVIGLVEWELLLRLSGQDWVGPRETLVDQVYSALILLAFIAFENLRLPLNKAFNYLGTHSFGVYLVHSLGIIYAAKMIYRFAPNLLDIQPIFQVILYAAGLGVPVVLMWIVDHSPLRRIYSTIFG